MKTELERLNVEVIKLGWQQRDALISHVYSGYTKHKELNEKRKLWSDTHLKMKVIKWVYDLFIEQRDLFGYFESIEKIKTEINIVLEAAIRNEDFEIAEILKKWLAKCEK